MAVCNMGLCAEQVWYRSKAEMAHTCRGTMVLKDAKVINEVCSAPRRGLLLFPSYSLLHSTHHKAGQGFSISTGNRQTGQQFYLKARSERERLQWITMLELARQQHASVPVSATPSRQSSIASSSSQAPSFLLTPGRSMPFPQDDVFSDAVSDSGL